MRGDDGLSLENLQRRCPARSSEAKGERYSPFGLRLGGLSNTSGVPNRYRYNGKELNDELGLNWYDYGARMYDPAIGRWNGVDALAEKYHFYTPYNYAINNPIIIIDPNGKEIYIVINGETHRWQDFKQTNVESARKLKWAIEDLQKTQLGEELWDDLDSGDFSQNNDVYISITDEIVLPSGSANATTLPNLNTQNEEDQIFFEEKDGKTVFNFSEKGPNANLNGIEIQDTGKNIHAVAFSKKSFDNRNSSLNANTIYHELLAHVKSDPSDKLSKSEDHEKYGLIDIYDNDGNYSYQGIIEGSAAHQILIQLKDNAKFSSDRNAIEYLLQNNVVPKDDK